MYYNWVPEGWRCPQCGRVYSPTTSMCFYCSNQKTWTSPHTITTDDSSWWEEYLKQFATGRPSNNDLLQ